MRFPAAVLSFALLAGCASEKLVTEGDRKFEGRDFDGAAEAYAKAAEDAPADRELATKLDAARQNAAIAHAERAAEAAERGDLDRALAEIGVSRKRDAGNPKYASDEKKYKGLKAEVAATLAKARTESDPAEAYRMLSSVARYRDAFPEIGIRLEQARDGYVRRLLASAEDLGKSGQWLKSQTLIDYATEISAKSAPLSEMVKATKTNVRVLELLDQGYKLRSQEDLEGALSRFQTAAELRPDAGEAVSAVVSTRRALSVAYAGKAKEAREETDDLAAYAWYARAADMDPEAPEVEDIAAEVKRGAAKALVARAAEAGKRGLTGLEWLRLAQARAVMPDDPAIDRDYRVATTKLDRAMRPIILVKTFRNATRHEGREVRLAAETYRLLQQQAGNGKLATIMDEDAYQIHLKENPSFTPDLIVKGTLERFDLMHHPDRTESQFKEYDKRVTFLDLQGKNYVEGIEKRTYHYTVTDRRVTGVGHLSYEIYDVGARSVMGADTVNGDLLREDRVVAGNKEAGVADDPNEMPADEALQDELQTQLKDRLLEKMRQELGWVGRRYYTAYERARESGNTDAAVSWAVIALRSLQAADKPAVASDIDFVLKRTGWNMKEGRLIAAQLR
ncbi:MAG: hypothetical protein HYY18_03675 [Planctomycetes bacterium]|nr:hypothetical protein [Planctomycetota bacterium]